MTKQTFAQFLQERKDRNATKTSTNFSKEEFGKVAAALINDPEHTVDVYNNTSKNEQGFEVEQVKPAAGIRKMIHRALLDYGVDAQEAETMLNGEFQFKGNTTADLYEFVSELVYQYADGNRFKFLPKQDSDISLTIDDVAEATVERSVPKRNPDGTTTVDKFNQHTKAHKRLSAKSAPPSWLKTRLN